jgi:DNA-directed RNA polymerase subunit M/transcription elongation factor TFIIS
MRFCNKCNNMYYIKLFNDDKTQLSYYCKKCGNEENEKTNVIVSKTNLKNVSSKSNEYSHLINKYTKLDPTLPRKNNVKCPNVKCLSNAESDDKIENEVLFIRYDDVNMKYIYMCCNCDSVWNNN